MSATLLLLLFLPFPGFQDDPEAAYREQYGEYTRISELTDPAAQAEEYFAFIEEGFDDRLEPFVYQGLQGDLQALTAAGNFDLVFGLAERWLAIRADDARPVALALEAANAAGNPQQVVKYGEMFYAVQAVPQVALILAQNYSQLSNAAKVREYGEIALDNFPLDQTWNLAYELVGQHEAEQNSDEAAGLAKMLKNGLNQAPEGVSASQWDEIQRYLQNTIAGAAYEAGRWQEALQEYNTVLAMNARSDEAYYYIGQCQLKLEQFAQSMDSFAKSYVLDGDYSEAAYEMLETIYTANTGGSLEGLDNEINDARRAIRN